VSLSVNNGDGCCVFDKEEGVDGIWVAKEARYVVIVEGRISNLLEDFLFPIDQLQWFIQDTSKY
jgi:hypothetical protein